MLTSKKDYNESIIIPLGLGAFSLLTGTMLLIANKKVEIGNALNDLEDRLNKSNKEKEKLGEIVNKSIRKRMERYSDLENL